ncbi:EAP30/Vps36 family vacuolar-sorting protein [Undibacterium umbellatum]|nr:EAP30/Vps36 family vacuolar-sorting protein [Undibacterium umbellatum]
MTDANLPLLSPKKPMPLKQADFTDDEIQKLEAVRLQWGLADLNETAEFLARRALRLGMMKLTGRSRAMNLVSPEDFERTTECE